MTDRELLELAAKAAGYEKIEYHNLEGSMLDIRYGRDEAIWNGEDYWNPLVDDCEALRLAVKLNLIVGAYGTYTSVCQTSAPELSEEIVIFYGSSDNLDPYAATRRAIVRAAAEIGKNMEVTK
jgi:hypothetical protein